MKPIAHGTRRTDDVCCWPECFQPVEHPELPLCEGHLREAGLTWLRENIEWVRESVLGTPVYDIALDQARRNADQKRAIAEWQPDTVRSDRGARSIVYYIQVRGAERVKIGTTTNLRARMVSLRADGDDLLATEPGGYDVELARHRRFADERYGRREEFALSDRLRAHITSLQ